MRAIMDRAEEIPLRITPVLRVPILGVAGIRILVRPGVPSDCHVRRVRQGLIDPGPGTLETAPDRDLALADMPGARPSRLTGLMRAVATVPPGAMPKDMAAMVIAAVVLTLAGLALLVIIALG